MSKTSDESLIVATARAYWKRFAASVTAFGRRYDADPYLRTEVRIGMLQVAYALVLVAIAIGALVVLYSEMLNGIGAAITTALTSTTTPLTPESITGPLKAVRTREIVGMSELIVLAAIVFGYLVSRVALGPTRSALAAQKVFIGNIAHELRTPLSVIKTNTEVRLLDSDVSKDARDMHEANLEELDRISDIIHNLLTVNALIQPERIRFENVDLGAVARHAVERFTPVAKRKSVRLRTAIDRAHSVWGNHAALEQIASNLVKNAVQHTDHGQITVRVAPAEIPRYIELSVTDSGTGIPRENLPRLFQPFYRGDPARTRKPGGGSGLGLSIVSELVKLHRGQVSIRSTPGAGTSVHVLLPVETDAARLREPLVEHADETIADFTKKTAASE